jgi:Uma2 family endonuclease
MSTPKSDYLTSAEYLEIERRAETKSEYIDGRMYAMSGASEPHNVIAVNLTRELSLQMRGRPCRVYAADMRVKVSPTGAYMYPDVVAVCGERKLEDKHLDTLLNPTIIFEVLSDSTAAYDRDEKFFHYRQLDSLQEFVLVSQKRMMVEHYIRDRNEWRFSEITAPEARVAFPSIGCDIAVADIYENVDFRP